MLNDPLTSSAAAVEGGNHEEDIYKKSERNGIKGMEGCRQ
jgi:hypothetical protein